MLKAHQLPHFFIDSRIDMTSFVNPHKVIAKRNAFSAFPSVWNGVKLEGKVENEELKCQFSQMERDLDLQEILKLIPISNKWAPKKKDNEYENVGKNIHYV